MARIKKEKVNPPVEEVKSVEQISPIRLRDENGLLKSVKYAFDKNGFVDWRKMVNPEHVILNKYKLAEKGIDVDTLSDEDKAQLLAESGEEDLLIKLAGFRELANLRGYSAIETSLVDKNQESASVKVNIVWSPNFENQNYVTVSAIANANLLNTDFNFAKYLETIAENRAFVRAVRNSLGIYAVGYDEIKNDDPVKVKANNPKPQGALQKIMDEKKISFDELREFVTTQEYGWEDGWTSTTDIPSANAMSFFSLIKKEIV